MSVEGEGARAQLRRGAQQSGDLGREREGKEMSKKALIIGASRGSEYGPQVQRSSAPERRGKVAEEEGGARRRRD